VNNVEVNPGIGFTTKNTPTNQQTKGSLKFKGKLNISVDNNNQVNCLIY
jgi:hypothetical protein